MFISRWKMAAYVIVLLIGCLIAAPNLLSPQQLAQLPHWFPKNQMTLGLDLKGGSHIVLEIDGAALRKERLESLLDNVRRTLREARIPSLRVAIENGAVTIKGVDGTKRADVERLLSGLISTVTLTTFSGPEPDLALSTPAPDEFRLTPTEAAILAWQNGAAAQSLEIIRRRIDEVGVAEPTIQRLGPDRILVQLPGVQDPG